MDVPNAPGIFEIDTTCTDPANHLLFVNNQYQSTIPSFSKGTIEIVNCLCPSQGDMDGNGVLDVFDVIEMVRVVFAGGMPPQDPGCPIERSDYNNDGISDVFDVIALIDGVFSSGSPPVDPCA
jgi:hypothetical protein